MATCGFHPRRGVEFHRAPALDTVLQGSIFTQLCRQLGGDSFGGLRAAAERHEELLEVLAGGVRAAEEARISTGVSGISLPGI